MQQIEGQISLFDLFENDDFETMTLERAVELISSSTGLQFKPSPRWQGDYEAKKNGFVISLHWGRFATNIGKYSGMRFLSTSVEKGTWGHSNPAVSIDESIRTISRSIEVEK